ncbi:AGC kinase [Cryptosporidium felis]|nr:AGC kinase [Cryptosporidium felis]
MRRGFLNDCIEQNKCDGKSGTSKVAIENFKLFELIGTGNFTQVFRAYDEVFKRDVAIKIAIKSQLKSLKKEDVVLNEKKVCMLINQISSRHVIKLLSTFADKDRVYMVYELCTDGELWHKILPIGLKPLVQAKYYLAQLLIAIEDIHKLNIVHRDIKAENCLLMKSGQLKLADFGSSICLDDINCDSKNCDSKCSCRFTIVRGRREFRYFVGTPQFMPPETIRNKPPTKAVDLWSFGCTVFQVLSGYPPFNAPSEFLVFCRVLEHSLKFPPDFPEDARLLVESLLKFEPYERATITEIKNHAFFREIDFEKLSSEEDHLRFPPSLRDLCFVEISKSFEKYKKALDNLNPTKDIRKIIERLSYEVERKEYEGPRDSWESEFFRQIHKNNDSSKEQDYGSTSSENSE